MTEAGSLEQLDPDKDEGRVRLEQSHGHALSSQMEEGVRSESMQLSRVRSHASSISTVLAMPDRLLHVTWAWYLVTMSTGGVSVLLGHQSHPFKGIVTIGKIVFILDIVFFLTISVFLFRRFYRKPELFPRSLRNPGESLFTPTLLLSLAHFIICLQTYGVPSTGAWLAVAVRVLFWLYTAISFLMAVIIYLDLFTARRMTDKDIVPAWVLPILPVMLVGSIAGIIAQSNKSDQRTDILLAGLTCTGLGFWTAISLYGPMISRLMRIGLPAPPMRPGMFIAVAPPSYTALALMKMSTLLSTTHVKYFDVHPTAPDVLQQLAIAFAILIWSLAFWWFSVSLASLLLNITEVKFSLMWYSIIFPNVGFILATDEIGRALQSDAITWICSAMSILLVATYLTILIFHTHAIWACHILWPGKDEDKET
jgi:C4-dicarboxylate transporter/malic acid transport protein